MPQTQDAAVAPITYWMLLQETSETLEQKLHAPSEEAARWVEAAAHNGSKPAIVNWGQMLLDGRGVGRDAEAAFRWFRIAADAGYPDGINMVGRCYELGWGVEPDVAKAARYYRAAAETGHHWARFNLGSLLLKSDGIERDVQGALSLLVQSARQGNAKAMNMIGRFREEGWHGRVKLSAAMRWYARAANRGCFRGQFHLARFLFAQGSTVQATQRLTESLNAAPPDFCRDAAAMLEGHADEDLRTLFLHALWRACASGEAADFLRYARALAENYRGMPPDDSLHWLRRAAIAGNAEALAELKRCGAPLPSCSTWNMRFSAQLRRIASLARRRLVRCVRLGIWRLRERTRFGSPAQCRPVEGEPP
jgi:TPR repeat protein